MICWPQWDSRAKRYVGLLLQNFNYFYRKSEIPQPLCFLSCVVISAYARAVSDMDRNRKEAFKMLGTITDELRS